MPRVIRREKPVFDMPPPPIQEELPLEGLRLNDRGRGVSTLQLRLGLPVTGFFNEVTDYAVRQVQRDLNLRPDGVASPTLHGRLGLPWPPLEN